MKRKLLTTLLITSISLAGPAPAGAIGKYDWWTSNVTSNWWRNGINCFTSDNSVDILVGQKFGFSSKLGQSKKFISLGKGVSISGDTLVDRYGKVLDEVPAEGAVDEQGAPLGRAACEDPDSVAYILPSFPNLPGAYIIRLTVYAKGGGTLWTNDNKILGAFTGAETGANFFQSPPNFYFNEVTNAYISSKRIKAYTNKGNPRNACLIIYDVVLKSSPYDDAPIALPEIIQSMQGGNLGVSIRQYIGGLAIPTAIKCAPWIADYLW